MARGPIEPTLDEVRAVTAKYRDVNIAKADGFTTDNKCVTAEMLGHPASMGAMGLHYVRRDLLGLPPVSPFNPDVTCRHHEATPAHAETTSAPAP